MNDGSPRAVPNGFQYGCLVHRNRPCQQMKLNTPIHMSPSLHPHRQIHAGYFRRLLSKPTPCNPSESKGFLPRLVPLARFRLPNQSRLVAATALKNVFVNILIAIYQLHF
jgi:hypothetical protein